MKKIYNNSHVIRGECDSNFYDGFWVFKGSKKSHRFEKGIILDRKIVEWLDLVDRYGNSWDWNKFRSEVAAIGSYLRSVRIIMDTIRYNKMISLCNLTKILTDGIY